MRHGAGRDCRVLVLLRVTEDETKALAAELGSELKAIPTGPYLFVPLALGSGQAVGDVDDRLYNREQKRWTASVAITRYR